MKLNEVSSEYQYIAKELSKVIDLDQCELREKYDRFWVKMFYPNFEFEIRFSVQNMNLDFRLYFNDDPYLSFNKVWKVWSLEQMVELAEYYYFRSQRYTWMHELIDDLLIDVRKEFIDEYYSNKYAKPEKKASNAQKIIKNNEG